MPCEDVASQIAALEAHISVVAYDDKELAEAEKTLRRAFRTTVQGSASSSEFFAGMYRTENKKFLNGRAPEYFIDPEHPDERRDRWVTQVHLKETSPAHFSKAPIDEQGFLYQSVHYVVNDLPERYLVFIRAQYMPEGIARGEFLVKLLNSFWSGYQDQIPAGINRGVLYVFAQVVIAGSGGDKFDLGKIKAQVGGSKSNWYKCYLPHWKALQSEYTELRRRSLSAFLASS